MQALTERARFLDKWNADAISPGSHFAKFGTPPVDFFDFEDEK